jgi:VCBS repeat-containing protein
MFKKSLLPIVVATALVGCGSDDPALESNSRGSIAISGSDFFAGGVLSATATDADGIRQDTISYVWSTGATGTTYTITEADEGSVISISARYTDEAGFTEGVGASTSIIRPTLDVTASVFKGPVSGATCEIFEVSDSGSAITPAQGSAVSADTGSVTFSDVNFEGTGLVSCTGGTYIDESTGEILDAPALRAVVSVVEGDMDNPAPSYVVSPLTEMAVQAAGADLNGTADAAEAINARFGIRFDTSEVTPTPVGVDPLGADGAENADRYGSVLALLSQLDADDADNDMAAILAALATDLADGSFSEAALVDLETAQTNLQTTSEVAGDVDEALLDVIGSAIGYNNDPVTAIIEGALSGTVQNTAVEPLMASVTVTDPNFEEDAIVPQTNVVLDFGTFSISADGSWSYVVDVANETVANLEVGNSVNDIVTIASIDGTTAEIDIRVAALTQVVKISDIGGDTGEIRFSVDNLRQGKLSASFSKDVALGSDGNNKDAYIALYGSSGSSSESLVDLRIQGNQTDAEQNPIAPRFFVRNTDSDAYPGDIVTAPFVEEQFYDVEIVWDLDATEQITIFVDGEVIGGGSFSTAAVVDSDFQNLDQWFADGVRTIQFRFGDNDRTIPFGSYYVDNISVYSDTAGTVSVFEDDFESYDAGDTLDGDNSPYSLAIYSEVSVFDVGDGEEEPVPAVFFDLTASIDSDEAMPLTGTVSVLDPNEGEASITPSSITASYGDFAILADGSWTYALDTADTTIATLERGNFVLDTITITSFDGTSAELVITILGALVVDNGPGAGLGTDGNQYANVTDVAGTSDDAMATVDGITALIAGNDTGELRIDLGSDNTVEVGRMTFQMLKGTESNTSIDGFILIGGVDTGSSEALLDLRLDQSGNHYDIRNGSTELSTYNTDTIYEVEISWDASAATAEVAPTIAITIDGVPLFSGDSVTNNLDEAQNGVRYVQFRVADNDDITRADFRIDELVVYETVDSVESVVFEDDFEAYTAGDSLDSNANDAGDFTLQQTPSPLLPSEYNNNSFSVTVDVE